MGKGTVPKLSEYEIRKDIKKWGGWKTEWDVKRFCFRNDGVVPKL